MKPTPASTAVAVAVVLSVAACAGARSGTVYNTDFTAGYSPLSLNAAMAKAPLLVETYGVPATGAAPAAVSRSTALALRQYGPPWLSRNYTDAAADAGTTPYHLRFAYGLPKAFDRQKVCAATMDSAAVEAARGKDDAGSTRTIASLCRGETTIGIAEGSPGAEPDINGESFARFVGLMGRQVMPRRNPVLDDDCIFRFCD